MVLLKTEKRSSVEVGRLLGCCEVVVNRWLDRFLKEGVKGLETRAGSKGRKPKLRMQNRQQLQKVEQEIARHRQSVKAVTAKLATELDLEMHPDTLKRFLKKIVIDSAAAAPLSNTGKWQRKEPRKKIG